VYTILQLKTNLLLFGCQYQCNRLLRLASEMSCYCVKCDVKPYTHSLTDCSDTMATTHIAGCLNLC